MKYFGILTGILFTITLQAQSFSGRISYGNSNLDYTLKLEEIAGHTSTYFSSIEMNAYQIPCQNTALTKDSLSFYVISDFFTYEYKFLLRSKGYKGLLKVFANETGELLNTFDTYLMQDSTRESDLVVQEEVTFVSDNLTFHGTLWKPKHPINKGLVFVTSSQGNDRSGSNSEAAYFAGLGYTVFNYDKRGTGKSEGEWQSASIEELCADDMNAITFFSNKTMLPLSQIGIKGSSQGGIKIPYILTELPELKFGISVSSPGGTLLESDLNHWRNLNIDQIGEENIANAIKAQKSGYDYLANNLSYKKLIAIKNKYVHEDWFKYIWIPDENVQKDRKLNFTGLPYFQKTSQPILIIQGLSDSIIPDNSYRIIENSLKNSKSNKYKIITLENTSHSMTYLNEDYPYFQTLSPQYLSSITDWINSI